MKKSKKHGALFPADGIRTVILITHVSTHRQAENDVGSLKNQLQRLRAYMEYKRASGEDWPRWVPAEEGELVLMAGGSSIAVGGSAQHQQVLEGVGLFLRTKFEDLARLN